VGSVRAMDLKGIVEVAAGLAGVVSTSLEVQRRVTDRQLSTRGDRLRARAEELGKFLQIQTQLLHDGVDEQLTQQTISVTRADLDSVLRALVKIEQGSRAIKVDDLPLIRRWFLLFVPARRFAWAIHFAFYFAAWLAVIILVEFKALSRFIPTPTYVSAIVNFTILAGLLRYWALMEMRWAEGFRPSPSPLGRRMLWYSPASRRELIARAGIVFGLIQFGPFISTSWISFSMQALTFTQLSVYLMAVYAWSRAELSLATNPVDMKFSRNLRFLHWPQDPIAWFWMICFYFLAACTVFFLKQVATLHIIPDPFRREDFLRNGAVLGFSIGFLLSYLLPLYALNRILLAHSEENASARLSTTRN
jgi:hypothetical protein